MKLVVLAAAMLAPVAFAAGAQDRVAASRSQDAVETLRPNGSVGPMAAPGFVEDGDYAVTGLGDRARLNLREAPSTSARVLARLPNGARLRGVGPCAPHGDARWCPVEAQGRRGWAAARFLRGPQEGGIAASGVALGSDHIARASTGRFDATAEAPCAQRRDQPMGRCPAGVARGAPGAAAVVITMSDGRRRTLFFLDGAFLSADTGEADGFPPVSAAHVAGLFTIRVGDERYEFPEAFPFGG